MNKPDFTQFYRYDALTDLLRTCEREFPNLAALESIGKSYEGRDIWALTLPTERRVTPWKSRASMYELHR